jgi:rhodanese-related sulfurtransferase
MMRYKLAALSLVVATSLSACAAENNSNTNSNTTNEAGAASKESSTLKPSTSQSSTKNVTVEEANKLLSDNKDLVVLDVRTEEEYKSGHLKNAILMPHDQIMSRKAEVEKYTDKPVLVYCRTGNRSSVAVQTLEKLGFKNIYHMNEGITAWKYNLVK